jgi:hypothetical protein
MNGAAMRTSDTLWRKLDAPEAPVSPSVDGKAAKFSMSGPDGYSNELYFHGIAGWNNVSHFIYDLYFCADNPDAP